MEIIKSFTRLCLCAVCVKCLISVDVILVQSCERIQWETRVMFSDVNGILMLLYSVTFPIRCPSDAFAVHTVLTLTDYRRLQAGV